MKLAKERLWGFVTCMEVEEVASRGLEAIVNTVVEGFVMSYTLLWFVAGFFLYLLLLTTCMWLPLFPACFRVR